MSVTDIEDLGNNGKGKKPYNMGSIEDYGDIVREMVKTPISDREEMKKFLIQIRDKYKKTTSMKQALHVYRLMCSSGEFKYDTKYELLLCSNQNRAQSGVLVIAVFTAPYPTYKIKQNFKLPNNYILLSSFFAYMLYCTYWENLFISILPLIVLFTYLYLNRYKTVTQPFSCQYNCYFCPNEPDYPRSYVKGEPGVDRATNNNFVTIDQFNDRANSYYRMGHLDMNSKIELLVLGGTWSSYPEEYQEEFIIDIYYAANTYFDQNKRTKMDLKNEITINEKGGLRIIGLTLETRPDRVTGRELKRFRRFGVTRVQMGVQHTDDRILYRINREATSKDSINAIRLLKDCCFKVDIHLMPDLPKPLKEGVSNKKQTLSIEDIDESVHMPDVDYTMIETVCTHPDWQADQYKLYTTSVMKNTPLYTDYMNGVYKPYGDQSKDKEWTVLCDLLLKITPLIPEWVRVNRLIRDIPEDSIFGGHHDSNFRTKLENKAIANGTPCRCIRCREVKNGEVNLNAVLKTTTYKASRGTEYFLSFVSPDDKVLYGFLRLRLSDNAGAGVFDELKDCALIRELHVYGRVLKVGENNNKVAQHSGFGTRLVNEAIKISKNNNFKKIAVISGVGVRDYYRRFGFETEEYFMTTKI